MTWTQERSTAVFNAIVDGGPAYRWLMVGYEMGVEHGESRGYESGYTEGAADGYRAGEIQGRHDRASGEARSHIARDALAAFYERFDQAAAQIERGRLVAPEEAGRRCYCPTERARQALQVEREALEDAAHRENVRGISVPRQGGERAEYERPALTAEEIRRRAERSWAAVEKTIRGAA